MTFRRTVYLIKKDLLCRIDCDGNKPSGLRLLSVMLSPPGMAVTIFRLQSYFFAANLYPVSKILAVLNIILYGVEIDPAAQIDEGLVLGHANGLVIHRLVRIGKNCRLMHQNAISPNCITGSVVIGDNVTLCAGAKIIGVLTIGDSCVIGMNAVVTKSLPACSSAEGIPARITATIPPAGQGPGPAALTVTKKSSLSLGRTFSLIHKDMLRRIYVDGNMPSRLRMVSVMLSPPGMAVIIFRLQSYCWAHGLGLPRRLFELLNIILYKVSIDSGTDADEGFIIGHATGIAIGRNVTFGKNCTLVHHNSIIAIQPHERITLEDEVLVGAGARITGPVTIGHDSIIGMNAVVAQSLPPFSVAGGVPAQVIKVLTPAPPGADEPQAAVAAAPQPSRMSFRETLHLIRADILYRTTAADNRRFTRLAYLKLLLNPAGLAVAVYRLERWAWCRKLRIVAKALTILNIVFFSIDISPRADIGEGFIIAHANGIVITNNVRIGKNCMLTLQNTLTIGPREHMDPVNDMLVLEDGVLVGAGARIVGNTTVGHHSIVGMNSVVTRSAPPFSLLAGVPASVIGRTDKGGPSKEAVQNT